MTLVFVHGAGGSSLSFYNQKEHFPQADAVDLPGHPRGTPLPSIEAYGQWLMDYCLAKRYQGMVVAGHSMGGAIALWLALHHPQQLRGLILMSTGARLQVHPDLLRFAEKSLSDIDPWLEQRAQALAKVESEVQEQLLDRYLVVGPEVQLNDLQACDRFDVMERLREVTTPTLVIHGTEDEITPPKYSQYLTDHIPEARGIAISGGTHLAHLEYPAQVNEAIQQFLDNLGPQ